MELRSKEAEALFAAAYGLGSEHAVAFRRRLEHLRTYGCPVGLNTGRGRPASYGWTQLVQQTLALDLLDVGLPPERAARLASGDPTAAQLHSFLLVMSPATQEKVAAWVAKSEWPMSENLILFARLGELSNIAMGDQEVSHLEAVRGRELGAWNAERLATETSGIGIDFGLMVSRLIQRVAAWVPTTITEATASFFEWAESYDVHS